MNNLWIQTDDATGQHVQAIAGEPGAYRFIDTIGLGESQYAVITDEVRFSGQDLQDFEFIREYLHPYSYESRDELRRIYGDTALQIAAECVFETNARSGQILFKGTLTRCLHFIDAYVSKAMPSDSPYTADPGVSVALLYDGSAHSF